MSFNDSVSKVFPDVDWTGGSKIHVSLARQHVLPDGVTEPRQVMKYLLNSGALESLYQHHIGMFPAFQWLVDEAEFCALLQDFAYHNLQNGERLVVPGMLHNPVTGNKFYRMATIENLKLVGGIRIWFNNMGTFGGNVVMWSRFRIEEAIQSAPKLRVKVVEGLTEANLNKENVVAFAKQAAEPLKHLVYETLKH
jgi:hypothetical protein